MADRSVVYRLQADVTQFKAQMATAAASVKGAADKMTGASKESSKFQKGLTTLGPAAGKVGLVAAAGLGAAIMKAANFDQAMSNVQAATHETTGNMEKLRAAALKAGADTAFSATEAAAGVENLAKAGVSTGDILGGGLTGALDLAAAGEMGVAEAAEAAATAMTMFNLAGKDVPHVADLLAAGAGKAQGEVSDLSQALNQSGLVASQMGLSIEETVGSLSAFASAGLLGSDAGTSLKTMLLRLANPTDKAAATMEQFGIAAYDAQGKMRPLHEIAGQLQTAFQGQDQATRDAALATIFGSDAIRAANVLYKQGASGIQDWTNKVNDQGFAAETAATRLDNLKGDLEALGGALETALIGTGDGSQGMLRGLTQGLTGVINKYNELPAAAQSATGATLGVTAAVGGGIWVFSKLVQGISNTRTAFENLGISADKAKGAMGAFAKGGIVLGVAAMAGEVQNLLRNLEQVDLSDMARDLELFGTKGKVSGEMVKAFGADLGGVAKSFSRDGDSMGHMLAYAAENVDSFTEKLEGYDTSISVQRTRELDTALSQLAQTNAPAAADAFSKLAAAAKEEGVGVDQLKKVFPEYVAELERSSAASSSAAAGMDKTAAGAGGVGDALSSAKSAAEDFAAQVERLSVVLSDRAGLRDYEAAVDAATASVKENGKTLDINTEKGRANEAALDNIASTALKAAQNLKPMRQARYLTNARKDFVNAAVAMGMAAPKARALARDLIKIPKRTTPKVEERGSKESRARVNKLQAEIRSLKSKTVHMDEKGANAAKARIAALRAEIARINNRTVYIDYVRRIRGSAPAASNNPLLASGHADGGTVRGAPRYPYGDKVLTYLAPGEEVISNRYGQADRHRALLKAINAGRMANGGTVGQRVSVASPRVSVGGADVRVYIDGREVRAIVDDRMADHVETQNLRSRTRG